MFRTALCEPQIALYFYRVYAFNIYGDSLIPSNTVSTTTLTEPPADPSQLSVALMGSYNFV